MGVDGVGGRLRTEALAEVARVVHVHGPWTAVAQARAHPPCPHRHPRLTRTPSSSSTCSASNVAPKSA